MNVAFRKYNENNFVNIVNIIICITMNQIKTIFSAKKSLIKPNFFTFDLFKQKPNFIERAAISDQIKHLIGSPRCRNCVYVFWSPYGSGKTTLIKNIINHFNSNEHLGTKMIYMKGINSGSIYDITSTACSDYIARNRDARFAFVVDDYDLIYNDHKMFSNLYSNACSIAESSSDNGFKTILVVNDPIIGANILRFNGGEKFSTFNIKDYSWTHEQINNFIKLELMKPLCYNKDSPDIKDIVERIFQLGILSKNPLFIKNLISMYNANNYSSVVSSYTKNNLNNLHDPVYDEMAIFYEKQWIIGSKFID